MNILEKKRKPTLFVEPLPIEYSHLVTSLPAEVLNLMFYFATKKAKGRYCKFKVDTFLSLEYIHFP